MKVIAIICEYNPFHKGHERQINIIRDAFGADSVILSLMSGNWVQRGEAAVCDKYARAKAAVKCGSDIVLELPFRLADGAHLQVPSAGQRVQLALLERGVRDREAARCAHGRDGRPL